MGRDTKICSWCGLEQPAFSGRWCRECEREHGDEYREAIAEAASTPTTPGPTGIAPASTAIMEANRRRYRLRKARNQCQRCDQPARPGRTTCAECARRQYLRRTARLALRKLQAPRRLARLAAQQGKSEG